MNVSKATIDALYELITECFQYNRWFDRFVSVLGVKFACNNLASKIHPSYAHWFPVASDFLGDKCLETYNIMVEYGATDAGKQDYMSVTDMIYQMQEKVIDFQNMISAVAKIAFENNDLQIYAEIMVLLRAYRIRVENAILLNDKIGYYTEANIIKFDHDVETFWHIDDNNVIGREEDDD